MDLRVVEDKAWRQSPRQRQSFLTIKLIQIPSKELQARRLTFSTGVRDCTYTIEFFQVHFLPDEAPLPIFPVNPPCCSVTYCMPENKTRLFLIAWYYQSTSPPFNRQAAWLFNTECRVWPTGSWGSWAECPWSWTASSCYGSSCARSSCANWF